MFSAVGQAHSGQHASCSFKPFGAPYTGINQRKLNIFYRCQAGQKIVGLEYESDTAVAYGRLFVGSKLGDVLALKEREFILAANSIGTPARRIIGRHIMPNILSPIMVSATLGVASAIITESALSFLGLGFPSDFPTWGRLLFDGTAYISQAPSRVIWPGLAISLTVLSVNFIGDGLRDALDPRIRGR